MREKSIRSSEEEVFVVDVTLLEIFIVVAHSPHSSVNHIPSLSSNGSRTQIPRSLRGPSTTRLNGEQHTSNRKTIHKAATAAISKIDCYSVDIMYQFWVALVFECDQCYEEYTQEGTFHQTV